MRRQAIRKAVLLMFFAAIAPQAAAGKGGIKMLNSIPESYWGTWAPNTGPCKDGDAAAIVISAKAYAGPLGKCEIASVGESPSPKGPIYSARLQCADPVQANKKTTVNLIIRPGDNSQISLGSGFENLKVYQRCSRSTAAK
jgi:hypothetical protein